MIAMYEMWPFSKKQDLPHPDEGKEALANRAGGTDVSAFNMAKRLRNLRAAKEDMLSQAGNIGRKAVTVAQGD